MSTIKENLRSNNIFQWLVEKKKNYQKKNQYQVQISEEQQNVEQQYSLKNHLIGISILVFTQGLLLIIRSLILKNNTNNLEITKENGVLCETIVHVQLSVGLFLIFISILLYLLFINTNNYYYNLKEKIFLFLLLTKEIILFEAFSLSISYQLLWMPAVFTYLVSKNLLFLDQRMIKYYLLAIIIYTILRISLQYGGDYYIITIQFIIFIQMNLGQSIVKKEKQGEMLLNKQNDSSKMISQQKNIFSNYQKVQQNDIQLACQEITNFYTSILDMIPQGIIVIDQQKQLVECNKTSLDMLDCPRQKIITVLFNIVLQRQKNNNDQQQQQENTNNSNDNSQDKRSLNQQFNKTLSSHKLSIKNDFNNQNSSEDQQYKNKPINLTPRLSKASRSHELEDIIPIQQIILSPANKTKAENTLLQSNKLVDIKKVSFDIGSQMKKKNFQNQQNNLQDVISNLINLSHKEVDRSFRRSFSTMNANNDNYQQQEIDSAGLSLNMNFCDNDTVEVQFKQRNNLYSIRLKLCMLNYLQDNNDIKSLVTEPMIIVVIQNMTQQVFNQRLEIANQYKTRILASFSHELRTPLNCSINMLELLSHELNNELLKDYLEPALHSNYLLQYLINDILDFSSMEKGSFKYHFEYFSLKEAFLVCVQLVERRAKLKNLEFKFTIDKNLPKKIKSDKQRIQQIVLNLLNNALKYTLKGQIQLKVQYTEQQQIKVSVIDTGIGVDNSIKDKIFQLFGQTHISQKQLNSFSSCLGLTISQLLVKGLSKGQQIQLESEPGRGSTFSFIIIDQSNRSRITHYDMKEQITRLITLRQNSLENSTENIEFNDTENECNIKEEEYKAQNTPKAFFVNKLLLNSSQLDQNSNQLFLIQQGNMNNSTNLDISQINSQQQINFPSITNNSSSNIQDQQNYNKLLDQSNQLNLPINMIIKQNSKISNIELSDQMNKSQNLLTFKQQKTQASRKISSETTITSPGVREQILNYINNIKKCDCTDILIVDDNEFNLYSLKLMLQSYGLKVETTISGFSSLEVIKSKQSGTKDCKHFKLILMDIDMPLMNGYETTKKIISFYKNKDFANLIPPIVACTAFVEEEEKNKCFDAGMQWFINKPVSKQDIEYVIENFFLPHN